MRKRRIVRICILSLLLAGIAYMAYVEKVEAVLGWKTAIDVKALFYTPLPHYGATYSASCGSNQYYTGPSGQPAGYDTWNWWPSSTRWALLLEKSWLIPHPAGFTPGYHHAYMTCYG